MPILGNNPKGLCRVHYPLVFFIAEVASENLPTFAANLLGIFIQGVSRQVSKNSLKSGIGGRITKSFNVVIGKSLRFVLV